MIDTARTEWPRDMQRAAAHPDQGMWESMACDVVDSLRTYIREKPETAALWALGIGFVLGWRLKPW
jgi:ElaB/YqjD/DUF883 family membrane-anchored ribosome-binding protein